MSETSSIYLKRPLSYCKSLAQLPKKCKEIAPSTFPALLWTFSGIYSVSKNQFNANISGSTYIFPICDMLLMFFATLMLYKGLEWRNTVITLPWMLLTLCSLYFNQFNGIMANIQTLKQIRHVQNLPIATIITSAFLLVARLTLCLRVFQLYIYWWFRNKLDLMKN